MLQQGLTMAAVETAFTAVRINVYEPVALLCKIALASSFGMDSRIWRIVALALHALNGCLVLEIVHVCLARAAGYAQAALVRGAAIHRAAALVAAVVYAVHPCHAEIIGWPSAMPYALAASFFLAALLASGVNSSAAALLYLAAFLSKSITVTLPAVVAAAALPPMSMPMAVSSGRSAVQGDQQDESVVVSLGRGLGAALGRLACNLRRQWGLWAVAVAALAITVAANHEGDAPNADVIDFDASMRPSKACLTIFFYVRTWFWPWGLRSHYAVRIVDTDDEAEERHLSAMSVGLLTVAAAMALIQRPCDNTHREVSAAKWRRRRGPSMIADSAVYGACWAAYLVMFLPGCGIIQHGMVQKGGDRYAYLPYVAATIAFATGLKRLGMAAGHVDEIMTAHEQAGDGGRAGNKEDHDGNDADQSPPPPNGTSSSSSSSSSTILAVCTILLVGAAVTATFVPITARQVRSWRSEEAVFLRNLAVDPHDWRTLDDYADMIKRYGRPDAEAKPLYDVLGRILPPYDRTRESPKRIAMRAKMLIAQSYDNLAAICDMYEAGLERHPDSAMLANNVGVCHLRDPSTVPLAKPLFEHALRHYRLERELRSIEGNINEMAANADGSRPYRCGLIF